MIIFYDTKVTLPEISKNLKLNQLFFTFFHLYKKIYIYICVCVCVYVCVHIYILIYIFDRLQKKIKLILSEVEYSSQVTK